MEIKLVIKVRAEIQSGMKATNSFKFFLYIYNCFKIFLFHSLLCASIEFWVQLLVSSQSGCKFGELVDGNHTLQVFMGIFGCYALICVSWEGLGGVNPCSDTLSSRGKWSYVINSGE